MSSRIRYEKTEKDGILHSVRNFHSKTTDAMYYVILDTNSVTYKIKNMLSKRVYEGGEDVNNLHVLKRKVKERLEKLGVEFESEIRDNSSRVKGVNCGYTKENTETDV